jgi:hypothetical protein
VTRGQIDLAKRVISGASELSDQVFDIAIMTMSGLGYTPGFIVAPDNESKARRVS